MAEESYPMTPAGREKLRLRLKQLKDVERHENVRDIEAALEHGDLRENAEYHAAKERQGQIDAEIRLVEHTLGRAQVIDPADIDSETIGFGATVTLLDMETDKEQVYALVGEHETDVDRGRISIKTPVARALLGKREGDEVTINLPKGVREYEVVSVAYQALD
ncbi:transcription elongation factor GreA [Paraliomyxa miuraensis]|uniref:transcription elongation factor GreA n=1 Tax=Paraliomyxa miuraensis TaxID=376150 RepID=UPI002251B7C5|nr:transcription elongation factor GreA [Paraliomyxa miuraensis]MCX4242839.1 transcription elongation factor GreA [Paraliomyxa miuraensis]